MEQHPSADLAHAKGYGGWRKCGHWGKQGVKRDKMLLFIDSIFGNFGDRFSELLPPSHALVLKTECLNLQKPSI